MKKYQFLLHNAHILEFRARIRIRLRFRLTLISVCIFKPRLSYDIGITNLLLKLFLLNLQPCAGLEFYLFESLSSILFKIGLLLDLLIRIEASITILIAVPSTPSSTNTSSTIHIFLLLREDSFLFAFLLAHFGACIFSKSGPLVATSWRSLLLLLLSAELRHDQNFGVVPLVRRRNSTYGFRILF